MLRLFAALFAALLVCSCTTYPMGTPSGRPEVAVKGSMSRAKNIAIGTMALNGYNLTSQSANVLTFQSQMTTGDAVIYLAAFGNSNYSTPVWIARLTFIPTGGTVKILGNVQGSATSPFGQAANTDTTTGRSGQRLQAILQAVQTSLR